MGKKNFHGKKGLCQFLNIPTIYHRAKNQENNNEPFPRKKCQTDGRTDNGDFIGPSVGRGSNNNNNNDSTNINNNINNNNNNSNNNNNNNNNNKLFFALFTEVNVRELSGKK